jgi:hypothetical protein
MMTRGMHVCQIKGELLCTPAAEKEVSLDIAYFNHLSLINRKRVLVHTTAPVMTAPEGSYTIFLWYKSTGKKPSVA